jgi:hypothetical protein
MLKTSCWSKRGGTGAGVFTWRILRSGLLAVALAWAAPAAAATFVVDDDGTYDAGSDGCDGGDAAFTVIQAAITAAADGDTVFVCPGTYNENQILVNKALTVQGSGADVTIIDGGGSFGLPSSQFGTIRLVATTGDVLFDGFTVQNPRATTSLTALRVGIAIASSQPVTITVTNNVILGTGNPAYGSDYGVYAFGPIGGLPSVATLVFRDNEVRNTGSNTILIERFTGPTDVSDNALARGLFTGGLSAYVNMSHTNTPITTLQRVSHNTIDMAPDPGPYTSGNGGGAISFIGALTGTSIGTFSNVEITHNTITNVVAYRRGITLGNNANSLANSSRGVISNALIECNRISGPGGGAQTGSVGIRLSGNVTAMSVVGNDIVEVGTGFQGIENINGVPSAVTLTGNAFRDTPLYGVDWRSVEVIDAELNWWGSASGPTVGTNPGGTGGAIGASGGPVGAGVIDYSDWLASGTDSDPGPCFVPVAGGECVQIGTCNEIDGCTETPLPDGTSCGGGLGTCNGGVCGGDLVPIVLSRATLRTNTSTRRPNGVAKFTALVDDNDTAGDFEAALLAGIVSVDVTDGSSFTVSRPLTNCVARRAKVRCISTDGRTRARFFFRPLGPYVYTMNLAMRGLDTPETGSVRASGNVSVTINQGLATRSDTIGNVVPCLGRGAWRWDCHER